MSAIGAAAVGKTPPTAA